MVLLTLISNFPVSHHQLLQHHHQLQQQQLQHQQQLQQQLHHQQQLQQHLQQQQQQLQQQHIQQQLQQQQQHMFGDLKACLETPENVWRSQNIFGDLKMVRDNIQLQQQMIVCNGAVFKENLENFRPMENLIHKPEIIQRVDDIRNIEESYHPETHIAAAAATAVAVPVEKEHKPIAQVPEPMNEPLSRPSIIENSNQNKTIKEKPVPKPTEKPGKKEPKLEAPICAKEDKAAKAKKKAKEIKPEEKVQIKIIEPEPAPEKKSKQKANAKKEAASVAPWTLPSAKVAALDNPVLSLSEIQKAERERRLEQDRVEQKIREEQQIASMIEQRKKESLSGWNVKQPNKIKSLPEIQAEESKARQTVIVQRGPKQRGPNPAAPTITESFDSYKLDHILAKSKETSLSQKKSGSSNKVDIAAQLPDLKQPNLISSTGFWDVPAATSGASGSTTKAKANNISQSKTNPLAVTKESKSKNNEKHFNGLSVKSSGKNAVQPAVKPQSANKAVGK